LKGYLWIEGYERALLKGQGKDFVKKGEKNVLDSLSSKAFEYSVTFSKNDNFYLL